MQVELQVIEGPHCGLCFTFDGHDNFIVGRARCAHFRLAKKDPYFSRVHFMIEVNPPRCRLVDMGSMNGTKINGQRVEAAELRHGDLIAGGDTVMRVTFLEPTAVDQVAASEERTVVGTPGGSSPKALESTEAYLPELPSIEGYRIVRELGRGGMGIVYLAVRLADSVQVALKTIRPAMVASDREVQRFLREASILRDLRHPNVVAFHEMGVTGELLYFAMDYVPGTDASRLLERDGPLEIGRAIRLICEVLEALHYAHNRGFVHRDVKPSNLLVSGSPGFESCKLADFGLARMYHSSPMSGLTLLDAAAGTVPYMAPEQITHYRDALPPADQYATAATLYRLLTGTYAFDFTQCPQQQQLAQIILEEPVPIQRCRSDVPDRLARAIHRALQKDPTDRFPDAAAFRDALLPFAGTA